MATPEQEQDDKLELNKFDTNVTVANIQMACRMCGIYLADDMIDNLIDIFELVHEKGKQTTIKDIEEMRTVWAPNNLHQSFRND